ncbi:MAG: J domain-containing protein [Sediminibacterium sp.]|nr:J domain-containing protein [Chitinophagaceae bacterium]MCA6447912.1 J domain-containing protein [Chitinophagaceae bacterium]
MDNHYKTLGISPTSSLADIKSAYRKLAHFYHPDKHNGNLQLTEQFEKLKAAYEVLADVEERKKYDAIIFAGIIGKGNAEINSREAFYEKLSQIIKIIKQLNTNQIDYDWITISVLTLLRSKGIQDALLYENTERNVFNKLSEIISILPYKEMNQLENNIYTIFSDKSIQVKWEQIVLRKKWKDRKNYIIILLALFGSVVIALLIMRSVK